MKKVISIEIALVLLLAGIMFLLLSTKEPRMDVTVEEVQNTFSSIKGDIAIDYADALRIRSQLGINPAEHDMVVYYSSAVDAMYVYEFLLIRTDENSIDALQSTLEEHITTRLEAFRGYGESQTVLLEKAIIKQYGNYICLIVADEPSTWLEAVKELLEV